MTARHVAVVGAGRLARSLCCSLAALRPDRAGGPVLVTVLARDPAAAAAIARVGTARAVVSGSPTTFAVQPLDYAPESYARLRPDVLVCCASDHSPYEHRTRPSAWTSLVARAGFGATLALQAAVVVRLARALGPASPDTLLVNGAFPDAVNPLLAALGHEIHCGIGNIATLAAALQAALGLPDQRDLRLLAHHVHLGRPAVGDELLAWHGMTPLAGVTDLLAPDRCLDRVDLNAFGGHAAAYLVADLLAGTATDANVPGPLGLPGGYPVRLHGRDLTLRLPPGFDRAAAVAWNTRAGHRDGIEIAAGRVAYPPAAARELEPYLPDLAGGWSAGDLDTVLERFVALRAELRTCP